MNYDQAVGIARILVAWGVAKLVSTGLIPNELVGDAVSIGVLIVMSLWSYAAHSVHALLASVAAKPEVHRVVVRDAALARDVESNKVVGPSER